MIIVLEFLLLFSTWRLHIPERCILVFCGERGRGKRVVGNGGDWGIERLWGEGAVKWKGMETDAWGLVGNGEKVREGNEGVGVEGVREGGKVRESWEGGGKVR